MILHLFWLSVEVLRQLFVGTPLAQRLGSPPRIVTIDRTERAFWPITRTCRPGTSPRSFEALPILIRLVVIGVVK